MTHVNIKAEFPGCGKSYVLQQLYLNDTFKRKYYITPQNKQCVDVIDRLKANNCLNPNVQTYAHFVGNWRTIEIEDQTFYIMTDSPSKRAPTKKQIDLFIDEYTSLSKTQIDLIIKNFNIRNLFTAGDANQFEPIPYHNVIYENCNRIKVNYDNEIIPANAKILAEYHDDGSLPDLHIDKQYVLTKTKRTSDPALTALINAIKNADAETIMSVINCKLWKYNKTANDLHIAYTNKTVDAINKVYANCFADKQFIVKENDKQFGLMKGTLCNEEQYKMYVELKRKVFQNMYDECKLEISVDEALSDWTDHMFGYAYAVTSHKLQGADVDDRPIIIHLEDIIKWAFAIKKDDTMSYKAKQIEIAKRLNTFHKMLYVAVSRAKSYSQIYFTKDDVDNNELLDALNYLDPFIDVNIDNAVYTESDNYKEIIADLSDCFNKVAYASYNDEIIADACNMSFKEFKATHKLSIGTYKRIRLAVKQHEKEGSGNVAYKEAVSDPYSAACCHSQPKEAAYSNEIIANNASSNAKPAACCLASRPMVYREHING